MALPVERLTRAHDLVEDGREARASRRVVVLFYSMTGCPYCDRVRRDYLLPMAGSPLESKRILLREIDIDSPETLVDFAGRSTTQAGHASAQGVRFVPQIVFLGPTGEPVAEPLAGFSSPDLFGALLERRIDAGLARIAR